MSIFTNKRYVILGASRGLGWAIFNKLFLDNAKSEFLLISRKISNKHTLDSARVKIANYDFSNLSFVRELVLKIMDFNPTDIMNLFPNLKFKVLISIHLI